MADPLTIAAAIASSVQAGVELVKAVLDVLTAGRSVVIEVDNNTSIQLTKIADNHDHGGFGALPSLTIPPKTADVFGSQSKGGAIATGTEGSVTYSGDGLIMLIGWDNPFAGGNSTNVGPNNVGLQGPNANRFLVIRQTGVGNQGARVRFMLFIHPAYSLRNDLSDKRMLIEANRPSAPAVTSLRSLLPNTTSVDAT
jgi:hypothetical protein